MKRLAYPLAGIVVVVISVFQVKAMRQTPAHAPVTQSARETPRVAAEGRLVTYPGAEITVGSDVAGTIERIGVQEKDSVRKGDVIAIVRADDTRAALSQARSRVGEADADIRLYEIELKRAQSLFQQQVGARQECDRAERDLDAARARRASAVDEVRRLQATVDKSVIKAPMDGVIIERSAQPGESVVAGTAVVHIANLTRTRIEAEVDEFDVARVAIGDHVNVSAEGYGERRWKGIVEEVPDTVVSRRLKPQDPSKPIDTRVLLVKVAMSEPTPLKLGQRVDIEVLH